MGFRIQRSTLGAVMLRLLCISTPQTPSQAPPFRRPRGSLCRSNLRRLFFFPTEGSRLPKWKTVYMVYMF
jgi:hypothetical protein